jgi:hypothetical protein
MEFDDILNWWNDNKEWFIVPLIINSIILLLAVILMILTGRDVNIILKLMFFILLFACPFVTFYLGEYIDPYLSPMFDKIKNFVDSKFN